MNANREIYADIDQFPGDNGAGFFNVLAFRGVFFGSPFAKSNRYQWFNTLDEWEAFRKAEKKKATKNGTRPEEEYYVKKNCYGQNQTDHSIKLLPNYWEQRLLWGQYFNTPSKPSITEVYKWLTSSVKVGRSTITLFCNIGALTALLICGDLIEAKILDMPTTHEWGGLIHSLNMGAKSAMFRLGMTKENASKIEVANAFTSLNLALRQELKEEEKEAMDYNAVMLEHVLCKIKRLISQGVSLEKITKEI